MLEECERCGKMEECWSTDILGLLMLCKPCMEIHDRLADEAYEKLMRKSIFSRLLGVLGYGEEDN